VNFSWGKAIAVWWSIVWRGFLYGVLGGCVLGFAGGIIAVYLHCPEKTTTYGAVGYYLGSLLACLFAFKQGLSKHLVSLAALADLVQEQDSRG
jgi:hypothetical protein